MDDAPRARAPGAPQEGNLSFVLPGELSFLALQAKEREEFGQPPPKVERTADQKSAAQK